MNIRLRIVWNCQCCLWAALALWTTNLSDNAQGTVVYGHFPITSPLDPNAPTYQWDSQGYRLWGDAATGGQTYQLVINGQTAFTFYSGSQFSIIPSSLNGVMAISATAPDIGSLAVPVSAGQEIGSDALGYEWVSGSIGSTFTAARDGGILGQPPLTVGYFTGLASAYVGLQFQMDGQTHYGWARVGAPAIGLNAGWLYDYAYETIPNTPILAGQVPEPSTVALIILGAGVVLLRGKRKGQDKFPPGCPSTGVNHAPGAILT